MATETFESKASYKRSANSVYRFYAKCFDTIVKYLQEHGDIEIKKEENGEWLFCFLDYIGNYPISAIRLTEDRRDFYLDSYGNDKFFWDDINHDMIIIEMIMDKVL